MHHKIKKILTEVLKIPEDSAPLDDNTDIITDLGLDSLQLIGFIMRIEEEFDVELDFNSFDISHLSSITTFCDFISRQKTAGNNNW